MKLEDAGIKFDSPYRKANRMNAAFAVFQDPFGTLIEMSEGLSAVNWQLFAHRRATSR
jgi:hypothetical protein